MSRNSLFDRVAADYDSWYRSELGQAVDQVEREGIDNAFTPPGSNILEVGCGTGNYTLSLAGRGYILSALDVSGQMLAVARAKAKEAGRDVNWIQADVRKVLPKLGEYHGILSVTAFEFIHKPQEVLADLYKHLLPGGCLVIGIIAANSPWSDLYRHAAADNPESVFAQASFYSEADIQSWDVGASPVISKALYFPPTVSGLAEALKLERAQMGAPGFLVAKWVR
ncbi:class I SAM-dependent methyltransferase [Paradesulfitobacterium aromaticivorans]